MQRNNLINKPVDQIQVHQLIEQEQKAKTHLSIDFHYYHYTERKKKVRLHFQSTYKSNRTRFGHVNELNHDKYKFTPLCLLELH